MAESADSPLVGTRAQVAAWVEGRRVQAVVMLLIVINAALLGMETSSTVMAQAGPLIYRLDAMILALFVLEIGLRIFAHRGRFFRDPWSLFDFAVVAIALVPATGEFAVLRALRVLRVLRLFAMVKSMRRVVGALLGAIPGLSSIVLVLLLLYYVFAVIATHLFGATFPEWFGGLDRSMYTLFQVMTLESWSMGIVRPVMEIHPYAWTFFIPFILIATFTMLNLFIAIIVNAMQGQAEAEARETIAAVEQARDEIEMDLHAEVRALRQELVELKEVLLERSK